MTASLFKKPPASFIPPLQGADPWPTPEALAATESPKVLGVLLLNMGGPDSLEAVKPFLYNLFADNDIVQLPFPNWLQRLFAWRTSNKREHEAQENYAKIGGSSPLTPLSHAQAQGLAERLAPLLEAEGWSRVVPALGMRYWHPRSEQALAALQAEGITHLLVLPLYPHYCLATTGSSLRELYRLLETPRWASWIQDLPMAVRTCYYQHPAYVAALRSRIEETLESQTFSCPKGEVRLVFSAHGVPKSYVGKNQDPYPRQIRKTIDAVMAGLPNPHQLCWQSRVGPLEWLQPYTEDAMEALVAEGADNVVMIPISFVSDHIETLFEMDMLYLEQLRKGGLKHVYRCESLNTSPAFLDALTTIALDSLRSGVGCCQLDALRSLKPAQEEVLAAC